MLISVDTADDIGWGAFHKTLGKDLGVMRFPNLPGSLHKSLRMSFGPLRALSIAKWTEHPAEAYEYLKFLTSAKIQERNWKETGWFPNNIKATADQADDRRRPPAARLGEDSKVEKFIGFDTTIRPSVEATMVKLIPAVIIGQMSIKDALDQVQAAQEKLPPVPTK